MAFVLNSSPYCKPSVAFLVSFFCLMVFVSTSILFIPLIYGISMNLIMLVVKLEIVLCTSLVFVLCKETIGFDKY